MSNTNNRNWRIVKKSSPHNESPYVHHRYVTSRNEGRRIVAEMKRQGIMAKVVPAKEHYRFV